MTLEKGIVVATHPEDHSVDIVMAADGRRLVGVPVLAGPGTSARTGVADLPDVPAKANKWDITKRDGQDMEVLVGFMGRYPVVVGFLFPQINQVLPKAGGVRVSRHRSDVQQSLDADGNFQMVWPNGTYLRVGEAPDKAEVPTADASATDRNTGRGMHLRIGLAGDAGTITITPGGAVTIDVQQAVTIKTAASVLVEAQGTATIKAAGVTVDTPQAHFTGNVSVAGDVVASNVSLVHHVHGETMPGPGTTGEPVAS